MVNNVMLAVMAWGAARGAALRSFGERGQGIMEYSILVGGIALVAAALLLGTGALNFTEFRNNIQDCISFNSNCG
jgi:hypothetical protein